MNTYFLIVVPFVLLAEVILLPQVRLDYTGPRIVLSSGVLCTEYTSLGLGHRGTFGLYRFPLFCRSVRIGSCRLRHSW